MNSQAADRDDDSRPRGRRLSRTTIVRTAKKLATGGVDSMTTTTVAAALGVTPMALYRHIDDKDHLLELVLDSVLGDVRIPDDPEGPWVEQLRQVHMGIIDELARYPGLSNHLFRLPAGEHTLHLRDWMVTLLRRAGFGGDEAAFAYTALYYLRLGAMVTDTQGASASPIVTSRRYTREAYQRQAFDALLVGLQAHRTTPDAAT
jgi:AcrR family transcriptional regulator